MEIIAFLMLLIIFPIGFATKNFVLPTMVVFGIFSIFLCAIILKSSFLEILICLVISMIGGCFLGALLQAGFIGVPVESSGKNTQRRSKRLEEEGDEDFSPMPIPGNQGWFMQD